MSDAGGTPAILLVVEDSAEVQRLIAAMLRGETDSRLVFANDGAEAMRLGETYRDQLALAIVDLNLPDMPGPEVVLRLRLALDQPDLAVIYTSGDAPGGWADATDTDRRSFLLPKPFGVADLRQAVRAALSVPPAGTSCG